VTQGEIAHIHAHSEGGPRFDTNLSESERDSYQNTLLLCRRHHRIIDADPLSHPADLLKEWKRAQEAKHEWPRELRAPAVEQHVKAVLRVWKRNHLVRHAGV
jgi:hypothetical protein